MGIVGRTGSGKSTLVAALWRVTPFSSGQVCIGGIDIISVSLPVLRHRLAIIPQDPVLFHGTVRYNLDPEGVENEATLQRALQLVGLSAIVSVKRLTIPRAVMCTRLIEVES